MNPHFHTDFSISDSLIFVRKSVLIYETIIHAVEFKQLHAYYTTRSMNPLKKMQSLVVIACKILRVIYTILNTGMKYDPERMLRDIRYPQGNTVQAAA